MDVKATRFAILAAIIILLLPISSFAGDCSERFSWVPNEDGGATAGYEIHYGTTLGGPYTEIVDVGLPNPSAGDGRMSTYITGLNCNKTYYFICVAYNSLMSMRSDPSNQVTVDDTGQSNPTLNSDSENSSSTGNLSWTPNPESAVYEILYGENPGGPYPEVVEIDPTPSTDGMVHGSITGLKPDTTYYFICVAYNSSGGVINVSRQAMIVTTKARQNLNLILFMSSILRGAIN